MILVIAISLSSSKSKSSEKLDREWAKAEYYTKVKREAAIDGVTSSGNYNGINLLLISKLSEGYIKEYLTIAQQSSEGKINSYSKHVGVEGYIALNLAESGPYPNTFVPCSYLPFKDGKVVWKVSMNGLPAEALTLSKGNKNVFGGNTGSGPVVPYDKADAIAPDPTNGGTAGPFQISRIYINTIQPSKMNGYNADSGRSPDITYFPDSLTYIDSVASNVLASYFPISQLDYSDINALAIMFFAEGEGNVCSMEFPDCGHGTDDSSKANRLAAWKEYKSTLDKVDSKYSKDLAQYAYSLGGTQNYFTAICFAAVECGDWLIENDSALTNYLKPNGLKAYQILHPNATQSDFDKFLNEHTGSSGGFYINNTSWVHMFRKGSHQNNTNSIAFGHMYMSMNLGKYYYAYMLKMGGLTDVDPSNPSTFMNNIKNKSKDSNGNTEWVPGTTTDALASNGVDVSKLSTKRLKVLNEGVSILGVPYVWGGNTWPQKNSDGSYNLESGALDCSSFVQQCIKRALGIELPRTTYTQINSPLLERIDASQVQPGDILFNASIGHVLFYISGDVNGVPVCMHCPQTGDVVSIKAYHSVPYVYRLKGIDDP